MPRPVAMDRIEGIATAKAVRALMPGFDLDATLAKVEAKIIDAARVGRDRIDILSLLPTYDGHLTSEFVSGCRYKVGAALTRAGYVVTYDQGGHHGRAELIVKWDAR